MSLPTLGTSKDGHQNSTLNVYINPSFSADQAAAIQTAFNNYAGFSGATVNFTATAAGSNYSVSQSNDLGTAQGQTGGTANGSYRQSATTATNSGVTNLTALTQVMAHEIGHSFGEGDCGTCTAGSTPMTEPGGADINDTTTGRTGPGPCDANAAAKSEGSCKGVIKQ